MPIKKKCNYYASVTSRNEEINPVIDRDPKLAYFRQMENGLYNLNGIITIVNLINIFLF